MLEGGHLGVYELLRLKKRNVLAVFSLGKYEWIWSDINVLGSLACVIYLLKSQN